MIPPFKTTRIVIASLVAAAGLVVVGSFDYAATRSELLQLLYEHAQSLRQTIAAAARSNQAAGVQAERQVSERLLRYKLRKYQLSAVVAGEGVS